MLTLGNLSVLLLLAVVGAWLWHAHGVRERALRVAQRHCAKMDVQLLDDNVAFRRLAWLPDAKGRKRLARVYGFEFTVDGEQRYAGTLVMFGAQLGSIELQAHPWPGSQLADPPPLERAVPEDKPVPVPVKPAVNRPSNVVRLDQWKRNHPRSQRDQKH